MSRVRGPEPIGAIVVRAQIDVRRVQVITIEPAARRAGGAGLGLSVSRRLARALGGHLSVVSDIGKGSRFRFWLPRERS
ncbi:MAG TPA: ATP-binding protein [Gemmatimonadaceae bacterium]